MRLKTITAGKRSGLRSCFSRASRSDLYVLNESRSFIFQSFISVLYGVFRPIFLISNQFFCCCDERICLCDIGNV